MTSPPQEVGDLPVEQPMNEEVIFLTAEGPQ